jgi:hypothetical protein
MRTLIWLLLTLLAGVLLLAIVGHVLHVGDDEQAAPTRRAREEPWISFVAPNGEFSVLMPITPIEGQSMIQAKAGVLKITHFEVSKKVKAGTLSYAVTYSDYPMRPEDGAEFLNLAADTMAQSLGKVLAGKVITLQGYPGREYQIEREGGTNLVALRSYFYGSRQYQTIAVVPISVGFSSNTWRFLDSFRFQTNAVGNDGR